MMKTKYRLILDDHENRQIERLLDDLASRWKTVEEPEFLNEAAIFSHELPKRLRLAMYHYKLMEDEDGIFLVSGFPVGEENIGPTPPHWRYRPAENPTLKNEMLLILLGATLGEPIAWSTQQDGFLIHEVLPIKEHETDQLGFSSNQNLEWHTEDAFHPLRADYLGLMCLRNPTGTPTMVASIVDLDLSHPRFDVLFEPHFTIRPDESHLEKHRALDKLALQEAGLQQNEVDYQGIEKMNTAPEQIAVLFGDRNHPYMRLDPYFMERSDNAAAQLAFEQLIREIDAKLAPLVMQPGDYLFLDNYRAVHGRPPFKAHYDGNDRWLKRINLTRDLRKSRAFGKLLQTRKIS